MSWGFRLGFRGLKRRTIGAGGSQLVAPTLSWDSGTGETGRNPSFTVSSLLVGDYCQLQIDDDPAFGSTYGDQTVGPLSAIDAASGSLNFDTIPTLPYGFAGNARARYQRGGIWSPWSTTQSKTMDAAAPFSATKTYTSSHAATSAGARIFAAVPISTADPSRFLTIQVTGYFGGADPVLRTDDIDPAIGTSYNPISSASYSPVSGSNDNYIFQIPRPTGTTIDLYIISSSSDCSIEVWSLIGANATPTQKTALTQTWMTDPRQLSVTTPSGGITIVFGCIFVTSGTPAWSNATAVSNGAGAASAHANASRSTAGTATVSLTGYAGAESSLIALSYAPA